jgi:hypothetical protein
VPILNEIQGLIDLAQRAHDLCSAAACLTLRMPKVEPQITANKNNALIGNRIRGSVARPNTR